MSDAKLDDLAAQIESLRLAALDKAPVEGLTHRFYRYPARFSPRIASAAIEAFSEPGEVVLDPYMGGGTVIVEAMALGRSAVGVDLNQLATFVSRVKTRPLPSADADEVRLWADVVVPSLMYHHAREDVEDLRDDPRTRNLNLPCARPIKKLVAHALSALSGLTSRAADDFVRCAILKTSQWALDGRRTRPTLIEFRRELRSSIYQMLSGLDAFAEKAKGRSPPTLITDTATNLRNWSPFSSGEKADLVVTSPPYPGIHVLYHRWQVDGRRETPAPYWITGTQDGKGESYYTFASRQQRTSDRYFEESLKTLRAIRSVTKDGGFIIQVVAFRDPQRDLRRYLNNMKRAGFEEVVLKGSGGGTRHRTRRHVPGRKWHAVMKGSTPAAREVVLIHRAG